ncbi:MAG TPA: TPM domain-containing protein [Bdellovibrionota bacterium]|nr:TPM domain-containing protein [Bdellovibrionota bacterium]
MRFVLVPALSLLFFVGSGQATAKENPPLILHQRVTDFTGTLSLEQQKTLEDELRAFEQATTNQIAVLLIPSLGGREIRSVGLDIAHANHLGQKGKDNGALLFIAKEDRKMSIEVGYGLEGVLPDALCDQIIRNEIRPQFRTGNFFGGITLGVRAMMNATQGAYKAQSRAGRHVTTKTFEAFFFFLLIAIFVSLMFSPLLAVIFGTRYRISSKRGGGFFTGIWTGGGGWTGGGWSGGGGGGFSGGGGSFGGGGASGSW